MATVRDETKSPLLKPRKHRSDVPLGIGESGIRVAQLLSQFTTPEERERVLEVARVILGK